MVIIVRKNIRYGGAELLIERMANSLLNIGKECKILCNNISEIMAERCRSSNIEVIISQKWISKKTINNLLENNDVMFITTWAHDFILMDMFRYIWGNRFTLIHYVIAADDLCLGKSIPFCRKQFKEYYKIIIEKFHRNDCIVYMDYESIYKSENYYGLKLNNCFIVRLPYIVHKINLDKIKKRNDERKKKFTILSISRAEFPMKGYLLELISEFGQFYNRYPNSYLEIVTFGDGEKQLYELYNKYGSDVKNHITIHGKLKYEELENIWNNASLYVGLGTSILDASDRGLCAIPVLQYSLEFKANKMFYEIPEQISADLNIEDNGYEIIDKVYNMTSDEYISSAIMCYEALKKYYDVDKAMDLLISKATRNNYVIKWSIFDYIIEKIFLKYDDYRFFKCHNPKGA